MNGKMTQIGHFSQAQVSASSKVVGQMKPMVLKPVRSVVVRSKNEALRSVFDHQAKPDRLIRCHDSLYPSGGVASPSSAPSSLSAAAAAVLDGPAPAPAVAPARPDFEFQPGLGPVRVGPSQEADHVRLHNGALMPMVGYGTFQLHSPEMVKMALEVGYRHLDCAPLYKNEKMVGQGIREWLSADPRNTREQLFVTSKIYNDCHRPALLRRSAEQTIADLGCGYLDMLLLHWPDAFDPEFPNDFYGEEFPEAAPETAEPGKKYVKFDKQVSIEETWRAMESLVDDGLVRSIGISNFSVRQTREVCQLARIPPACNEIELHPFLQQRHLVQACLDMGVQCLAYGPLGGPNAYVPNDLLPHPIVSSVAEECGKSRGQVLVKWSMQRGMPVLVKTGTLARLQENLVGMLDWQLSEQQMTRLNSLECAKRFVDVAWKKWDDDSSPSTPTTTAAQTVTTAAPSTSSAEQLITC